MNNTKGKSMKKLKQNVTGWLFVLPATLIFVLFLLVPACMALGLSFTSYNIFQPPKFVHFNNYIRAFQDTYFLIALKNIGKYVLMFVPSVVILSFLLAVLLNAKVWGIKFFRVS